MNVIIPCAGLGSRFKQEGFTMPKPLIRCMLKPFLCWILDALQKSYIDAYVYIVVVNDPNYNAHYEDIAAKYDHVHVVYIETTTKGAADTIAQMIGGIPVSRQAVKTVCMDCDNFYNIDVLSICAKFDNTIVTFDEEHMSCYSFVEHTAGGQITRIVEKERISSLAVCGVYAFKDARTLLDYATKVLRADVEGELYMSRVVQSAIDDGVVFMNHTIDAQEYVCVGTPAQLYSFYNNIAIHPIHIERGLVSPQRVCFDLDATLVTPPTVRGDYSTCKPIQRTIDLCNYLKRMNHYIIIHTARRMLTHSGNVGAVIRDVGKVTIHTLERFNIQYDELLFGKPYADVYIDDKAVNANDDLQKKLGVYVESFETRSFNTIQTNIMSIVKKESVHDLSHEIFWYQNIPRDVKDLFPLFIGTSSIHDYTIERIQGDTISQMFVDGRFTKDVLSTILDSIRRLHVLPRDHATNGEACNHFYMKKLETRTIGYTKYKHLDPQLSMYNTFKSFFSKYTYVPCVIHGDPVFTNIIMNRFEKLKFIDMRGEFGDGSSIFGDPLYDYAKVNQSIIGYDFILKGMVPNDTVIRECKAVFDEYVRDVYDDAVLQQINVITQYLLYTMLPLHDERGDEVIHAFLRLMHSDHLSV